MKNSNVNWDKLCAKPEVVFALRNFAEGRTSGRELSSFASFTDVAGDVRHLLRRGGVEKARRVVKQTLSRRGL